MKSGWGGGGLNPNKKWNDWRFICKFFAFLAKSGGYRFETGFVNLLIHQTTYICTKNSIKKKILAATANLQTEKKLKARLHFRFQLPD